MPRSLLRGSLFSGFPGEDLQGHGEGVFRIVGPGFCADGLPIGGIEFGEADGVREVRYGAESAFVGIDPGEDELGGEGEGGFEDGGAAEDDEFGVTLSLCEGDGVFGGIDSVRFWVVRLVGRVSGQDEDGVLGGEPAAHFLEGFAADENRLVGGVSAEVRFVPGEVPGDATGLCADDLVAGEGGDEGDVQLRLKEEGLREPGKVAIRDACATGELDL